MDENLAELIADPSPERFWVYAAHLQRQGDPRGELIALDAQARSTGAPRDARADELELQLEYELRGLLADERMKLTWHRGFVRELVLPSALIPEIRDCRWFHTDDLVMLRSLRVADRGGAVEDCQPIDLIADAPFHDTLEHLAIGSHLSTAVPAVQLGSLVHRFPRLRSIELTSGWQLDDARLAALRKTPQIDSLALWAPNDYGMWEHLLSTSWQHLRALTVAGREGAADPSSLIQHYGCSSASVNLVELALLGTGWDDDLICVIASGDHSLMQSLQRLGLDWQQVLRETMDGVSHALRNVELISPRPPDVELAR